MMASFQKYYMAAGTLMMVYSLGFAIMFLLSALLMGYFLKYVKGIYKHFGKIKVGAGLIMIAMGILMLWDKMHWLNLGY
jgi:cytochrome c biogenesis protein CcdA